MSQEITTAPVSNNGQNSPSPMPANQGPSNSGVTWTQQGREAPPLGSDLSPQSPYVPYPIPAFYVQSNQAFRATAEPRASDSPTPLAWTPLGAATAPLRARFGPPTVPAGLASLAGPEEQLGQAGDLAGTWFGQFPPLGPATAPPAVPPHGSPAAAGPPAAGPSQRLPPAPPGMGPPPAAGPQAPPALAGGSVGFQGGPSAGFAPAAAQGSAPAASSSSQPGPAPSFAQVQTRGQNPARSCLRRSKGSGNFKSLSKPT